jgi:hypothetical protein
LSFKSNLRDNIKSKLENETYNSNLNVILPATRKVKSKVKKINPAPNLRIRTDEKKFLTAEDKEKIKKEGFCFYYREKG